MFLLLPGICSSEKKMEASVKMDAVDFFFFNRKCICHCAQPFIVTLLSTRGAFDLPESESGFEIMILIHRFI